SAKPTWYQSSRAGNPVSPYPWHSAWSRSATSTLAAQSASSSGGRPSSCVGATSSGTSVAPDGQRPGTSTRRIDGTTSGRAGERAGKARSDLGTPQHALLGESDQARTAALAATNAARGHAGPLHARGARPVRTAHCYARSYAHAV